MRTFSLSIGKFCSCLLLHGACLLTNISRQIPPSSLPNVQRVHALFSISVYPFCLAHSKLLFVAILGSGSLLVKHELILGKCMFL